MGEKHIYMYTIVKKWAVCCGGLKIHIEKYMDEEKSKIITSITKIANSS